MKRFSLGLCLAILSFNACSAQAQDKAQEDWLRYSNWEHRKLSPQRSQTPKATTELEPEHESSKSKDKEVSISSQGKLQLPENPGSQTVDGVQPSIPGWAFQAAKEVQRSPQIFVGGDTLGARPYFAPPVYYPGGGGLFGYNSGFNSGFRGWGHRNYLGAGFNSGWSNGNVYGWGGGFGDGYWQQRNRLGSEVIETGPSPASGNYYQPPAIDPSASGNYYAGGAPWSVPLNAPNTPKDYWGPQGTPFSGTK